MQAESKASPARVGAGGTVLSLIAGPLSVPILRAHLEGPLRLPDLSERIGGAGQTALRGQVGNLRGIGALERHVRGGMPYTVENELTDVGLGILEVADIAEVWLTRAPQGPIALGSEPAKDGIRALVGGWESTMLRALAARPLSLTELSSVIGDFSYPSLERRLSAMRAARQVEPMPSDGGRVKPFGVTEWTRQAVAPLIAAGRCECIYLPDRTEALTSLDVEAAFLLAVPLVDLRVSRGGSCLLAVDTGKTKIDRPVSRIAGVHVEVKKGAVVSCAARLAQEPGTWVLGTVDSWVEAILEEKHSCLSIGGEASSLARDLIAGLRETLFAGT